MKNLKVLRAACLVVLAVMLASCSSAEEKLVNKFEKIVVEVEKTGDKLSEAQWQKYDDQVEDILDDVKESLSKFTKEQREKIGNLYGRYLKVRVAAGMSAYQENLDNAMDVASGLMDEIGDGMSDAAEDIVNATSEKADEMLDRLDRLDDDDD